MTANRIETGSAKKSGFFLEAIYLHKTLGFCQDTLRDRYPV